MSHVCLITLSLTRCHGNEAQSAIIWLTRDSAAMAGDVDMRLGRCIAGTIVQVEFENGCGTGTTQ